MKLLLKNLRVSDLVGMRASARKWEEESGRREQPILCRKNVCESKAWESRQTMCLTTVRHAVHSRLTLA